MTTTRLLAVSACVAAGVASGQGVTQIHRCVQPFPELPGFVVNRISVDFTGQLGGQQL